MKPTIALFLHHPRGSVQCGNGIMQALSEHYNFKIFTRHELEREFFDGVDCVAFPGGMGDSDAYKWLFRTNGGRIRDYMAHGGRYLGIVWVHTGQDLNTLTYFRTWMLCST